MKKILTNFKIEKQKSLLLLSSFLLMISINSFTQNNWCASAKNLPINSSITTTFNTKQNSFKNEKKHFIETPTITDFEKLKNIPKSEIDTLENAKKEVWFQFTPTETSLDIFVSTNSLKIINFEIYSGFCEDLTVLKSTKTPSPTSFEKMTLTDLNIETIYRIRIFSTIYTNNQDSFTISISTPCVPGNSNGTSDLGCPSNVTGGMGLNGANPAPISTCTASTCTSLEVNFLPLGETTSYTVESIPYNPPYQFGCLQNQISNTVDDLWSPIITLPFNFCFYGNTYNQCLIGSNGTLTFDLTNNTPGGYSAWPISNNLPTNTLFLNTIFGVYQDIDPSVSGEIGWELITLNSGCRALVASWSEIPMYSIYCNSKHYTGMIVLYENTNIIEVYVQEKNICNTWNLGNAIIGIQNIDGTLAVVAPNRNSTNPDWSATNEAWRFVPSGAPITNVTWYEGIGTSGPIIGSTNIITVCPTATTTYTSKVSYSLCNGTTLDVNDSTTVTIINSKTWNESIDSDWNNPLNWTPNIAIPAGTDCVIIPITANNPIISGNNYNGFAGTLTINNGATLTINPTNNITITDWVNVQLTGTFVIENTASLIQINNVANTGNIIYNRTANNIRNLDYVYWSSPVAGFNINNLISPLISGPIWSWNTTIANPNGGQGNWENAAGQTMLSAKGYIARAPSSFNSTVFAPLNASFTGVPNNGNVPFSISRGSDQNTAYHQGINGTEINNYSDNWNLVGNPYPSAISGSQFLFDNNLKIEGTLKLWTHGTMPSLIDSPFYNSFLYNYSLGDYLTYNYTGTSCCPAAPADLFIGAAQGFFIQMKDGAATNTTINFNNNQRGISYNNNQFYRSNIMVDHFSNTFDIENIERNRIWLDLISTNNQSDRTLFGYIEGATMDYDSYFDSKTLNIGTMAIYSLTSSSEKYLIQGRQLPFNSNDEVSIGIQIQTAGEYTIALAGIDGIFETQNIYLKDNQLDIIHDLKVQPYQFTAISGINNNRFKIVYVNSFLNTINHQTDNSINIVTNQNITIHSTNELIDTIEIFDIGGRKLSTFNQINATEFSIPNFIKIKSVFFLKIKLKNGTIVTEKVIF